MTIITNVCQWSRDRTGTSRVRGSRKPWTLQRRVRGAAWPRLMISGKIHRRFRGLRPPPIESIEGNRCFRPPTADGSMEQVVEHHRRRTRRRVVSIRDDASPWHSLDAFRFLMTAPLVNEKCGARCTQPSLKIEQPPREIDGPSPSPRVLLISLWIADRVFFSFSFFFVRSRVSIIRGSRVFTIWFENSRRSIFS